MFEAFYPSKLGIIFLGGGSKVCAQRDLNEGQVSKRSRPARLAGWIRTTDLQTASRAHYRSTTVRINIYGLPTACSRVYH